jgi:hypothetical protein
LFFLVVAINRNDFSILMRYDCICDSVRIGIDQHEHAFRATRGHNPHLGTYIKSHNVASVLLLSLFIAACPNLPEVYAVKDLDEARKRRGHQTYVFIVPDARDFIFLCFQISILVLL